MHHGTGHDPNGRTFDAWCIIRTPRSYGTFSEDSEGRCDSETKSTLTSGTGRRKRVWRVCSDPRLTYVVPGMYRVWIGFARMTEPHKRGTMPLLKRLLFSDESAVVKLQNGHRRKEAAPLPHTIESQPRLGTIHTRRVDQGEGRCDVTLPQ